MEQIDKIDARILDCLQRDGRLSNAKLAERLLLSEPPRAGVRSDGLCSAQLH